MDAKSYLLQIERLEIETRNKFEELQRLKEMAVSIPALRNEERVQTSMTGDKIGNAVCRFMEYEEECYETLARSMEKRKFIISQIEGMKDSRYYCVLYYRYVLGVPLERLTTRMDYTWRNIRYLHKAALKKFEEMYLNDSNCNEEINEK